MNYKTWVDLLGPYNPTLHYLDKNHIVERHGTRCERLWTFHSKDCGIFSVKETAKLCFEQWVAESKLLATSN